jgi:hypothetical protein
MGNTCFKKEDEENNKSESELIKKNSFLSCFNLKFTKNNEDDKISEINMNIINSNNSVSTCTHIDADINPIITVPEEYFSETNTNDNNSKNIDKNIDKDDTCDLEDDEYVDCSIDNNGHNEHGEHSDIGNDDDSDYYICE